MLNNIRISYFSPWLLGFFLLIFATAVNAQKMVSPNKGADRKVIAKLLVGQDTLYGENSNNNNGRSNKEHCCIRNIQLPNNYNALAFGLNTSWYLWDTNGSNNSIPNPIPYLSSMNNTWEVGIYKAGGTYLRDKMAFITDNELIISIADLPDGTYFIEVTVSPEEIFHSGFTKGNTTSMINHQNH
ncbi:MAG: hypothetical protein KDC16_13010 [Saprospiraceae bacterium]|nr:hypothetical protein [Saprospiraceae bacterium]